MGSSNLSLDKVNYTRLNRKDKGFTLIELVLVLVLIAILISAAIFGYIGYQRMTNNNAAKQNYVVLMAAKIAWCSQNPGGTPTIANLGPFIGTGAGTLSDFALSGVTPTMTMNACNGGADLTWTGTLFGDGVSIVCSSTTDTPVVVAATCVSS